jgi:hypothetical protein
MGESPNILLAQKHLNAQYNGLEVSLALKI